MINPVNLSQNNFASCIYDILNMSETYFTEDSGLADHARKLKLAAENGSALDLWLS